MQESTKVNGTDTYKLTGETGSPRYMAPEIANSEPYNQKSDTYGFGLLLYYVSGAAWCGGW